MISLRKLNWNIGMNKNVQSLKQPKESVLNRSKLKEIIRILLREMNFISANSAVPE